MASFLHRVDYFKTAAAFLIGMYNLGKYWTNIIIFVNERKSKCYFSLPDRLFCKHHDILQADLK